MPTDPKRGFELMFRAYAPKQGFFDKTWKLLPEDELSGRTKMIGILLLRSRDNRRFANLRTAVQARSP